MKITTLKTKLSDVQNFGKCYIRQTGSEIKNINIKELVVQITSALIMCIAFAVFCTLREGTENLYMSVFIPLFLANVLIALFCCMKQSSVSYSIMTMCLITMGTALQIFMLPSETEGVLTKVYDHVQMIFIGILLGFFVVPLFEYVMSTKHDFKKLRIAIVIFTILGYLFVAVFGKETNNAQAWINVFGLSFQATEITKLLAALYFSLCLLDENLSPKETSVRTLIVLGIHAIFLFVLNELGTFFIITVVYFVLKFLYAKEKKYIWYELLSLLVALAVMLSCCYAIYKIPYSAEQNIIAVTVEDGNSQGITTTFVSETETVGGAESEKPEEKESIFLKIFERAKKIYPKLEKRVRIFFGSEGLDETDTYQTDSANKALLRVEWFGSEKGSLASVPEVDSDFVFIYLVARLGIVGVVLVLVTLFFMISTVLIFAAKTKRLNEDVYAVAFIIFIVVQSFLCICSNIGLFPVVGLPFAFLSQGGSAMCVNLMMTFYLINFLRRDKISINEGRINEHE